LEKDLNKVIKKIKNISTYNTKIKNANSNTQIFDENIELLDLKSELCALKNK
jgi:hypothetical protein